MTDDQVTMPRADLAQLEHLVESLEEASLDAQRLLSAEDRGWSSLSGLDGEVIDRESIMRVMEVARVMAVADPLIKRAVNLRVAYLGSPSVSASSSDDGQDINAAVQAFMDDPENSETFTSVQACAERERAFNTDGNVFHALITTPRGRVRVRPIPPEQVTDIFTDPEDAATPWLYKRVYTTRKMTRNTLGNTNIRQVTVTEWYPDVNFRPVKSQQERVFDGYEIKWDRPVVHTAVNRPSGSRWGVPDTLAAIPWARGYKDFLEDWSKLHKALATVAFRATAKTKRGAAQVREKFATVPADGSGVGGVAVTGEGQTFEAVSKAGATIDANSSKPLAGMVAAAMDLPVTMLLSDPGSTGARAVAETLDRPLELERLLRREVHADLIRSVLEHVIREAVRPGAGKRLQGTVIPDPETRREVVTLASEQPIDISVDWPPLDKVDVKTVMEALEIADGLDKVDPLTVARLVLVALGVSDVDGELELVKDDDGNFVPPSSKVAAAAQSAGYDDAGNPQGDTIAPPKG